MGFLFGGGNVPQAQQPAIASGLRVQTSIYGKAVPIVWGLTRIAANLIWYGDFTAVAVNSGGGGGGGGKGGSGGGGGKGGGGGSTTYNYNTAVMMGLCEGPIQNVGQVWSNAAVAASYAAAGFGLLDGSYSQSAWSYLTSNHPTEALAYRGLASVVASGLPLGSNPQLPQYSWEVYGLQGFFFNSGGGIWDCAPNAVITDFLTNVNYGVGFSASQVGDYITGNGSYYRFCVANDLLFSPALESQESASAILERWFQMTISGPVWSEGKLKIIPYSTETATGNGVTFTPNTTPEYDLTDNDYLYKPGEMPVRQIRSDPADAYNSLTVECINRANAYNVGNAEWKDQGAVDSYGLRPTPSIFKAHEFADVTRAATIAQFMGQRQLYIRRKFSFTLIVNYCRLEPMDLVTLTDSNLGLDRQLVRITEVSETGEDDGSLEFTAEEVPIGVASPAGYSSQAGLGFSPNFNAAPSDTLEPIVFTAPYKVAQSLQVWLGACGGANWGGCEVWISSDGNTYQKQGVIHAPARLGQLTAIFPAGSDPDNNSLDVDLTDSSGTLISGTREDADLANTLCYVDGEFVSYQTATLTSPYNYDLTYIRRGLYQTTNESHASGSSFLRIDEAVFGLEYTPDQIGKPLYIKLPAFNSYGYGLQSLADVSAFAFTVPSLPTPSTVTNFSVQQNEGVVVFKWTQVADDTLKGYDIGYAPQGSTNWSDFLPLTDVTKGTEMTNASVPPGSWTFGILARDVSDQVSAVLTTADLTIINVDNIISEVPAQPDFIGNQFLYSPGIAGNYASASITPTAGDLVLVFDLVGTDYTPATQMVLAAQWLNTGSQRGWVVNLTAPLGRVQYRSSASGTAADVDVSSTASPSAADGTPVQILIFHDVNNGAGGNTVYFYTRTAPTDQWQLLGTPQTTAGVHSRHLSTAPVTLFATAGGTSELGGYILFSGNLANFTMLSDMYTTLISKFEAARWALGASSAVMVTGETWTLSTSGGTPAKLSAANGGVYNFGRHPSGVLVPLGQHLTSDYVQLAAPSAPTLGSVAGGALGARTYFVKVTYTTSGGETSVSSESSLAVGAGSLLTVASPAVSVGASGYNVYVSTTTNTETLQTTTPIALGTAWTEPLGGLIAGAAMPTQNTTGWEPFEEGVPDPVPDAYYVAPQVDTAYDSDLRIFAQIVAAMLPSNTGNPNTGFKIDTWLTAETDPDTFVAWTIGEVYMRYLRAMLTLESIVQGSVPYISEFVPTADTAPIIVSNAIGTPLTVAAGGTTINWLDYGSRFHSPPNVQATAIAASALTATCVSITATQGTFHVWNTAGVSVGGSINWTATGE